MIQKKGGKTQMGIQWAKCNRGKSWFGGLESRQKGLSSPIWDLKNGGETLCFI